MDAAPQTMIQEQTSPVFHVAAGSPSSLTPETDAAWEKHSGTNAELAIDAIALCGKLERERDDARREAIRWQDAWMNETTLHEMGSTLMPWLRDWKKSAENAEPIHGEKDA